MKHTEFEPALSNIKHFAVAELRKAVEAHGGKFAFAFSKYKSPQLCYGSTVNFIEGEVLNINTNSLSCSTYCDVYSLPIEDILKITEAIPATKEVDNVSRVDDYNSSPDLLKLTL